MHTIPDGHNAFQERNIISTLQVTKLKLPEIIQFALADTQSLNLCAYHLITPQILKQFLPL